MDAALFLVLRGQKALLLGHGLIVLGDLALQLHRRLERVAAVELHLAVNALALDLQFLDALACYGHDLVHLYEGGLALGLVGRLVGVARHQHALAAALLGNARALLRLFAALHFQSGTLVFGQRGADAAPLGTGVVQDALLTVHAVGDGAVGGDAPAGFVDTGVHLLRRLRLRPGDRGQQAQRCGGCSCHEPARVSCACFQNPCPPGCCRCFQSFTP
uniref:Uncharacterized protein n=1 Tax=Diaphorobacter sp. PCA039 TaxID=266831 RepID=C0KGN7_9BURK|nr:conserved hypothetical protein [Diaphorobacter sp. PCA039]